MSFLFRPPVLGIDPGVNGGLAILNPEGIPVRVRAFNPTMPQEAFCEEVHDAVRHLRDFEGPHGCYLEKVGHITGDGGQGSFTFGQVDGLIRGVLWTMGLAPTPVSPQKWQSRLDCMTGGNKNVSKAKAIQLFPVLPRKIITHNTADALLIAYYGQDRLGVSL